MSSPRVLVDRFPSGAVSTEIEVNEAGDPHGVSTGYFETGQCHWRCENRDGERHGTMRFWFETGQLQSVREYLHGLKHGPFTDWHRNGQRAAEGEYRGDELVAVTEWDADGRELPGALERWQAQLAAASRTVDPAQPGNEMLDPAWQARQLELGEMFLALWLAPWATKRTLIEQVPDIVDRTRQRLARLMARRGLAESPEAAAHLEAIASAHEPLLVRCAAALAEVQAGGEWGAALDEIFDDHVLWLEFHARTGQPQE